jgi:signal transduction histidine kinase
MREWLVELGIAAGAAAGACLVQRALWSHVPHPHLFFYPAIFVAGRARGWRSGAACTLLSALAIAYWFLTPRESLSIDRVDDTINLAIFTSVGIAISVVLGRLRSALARSRAAEAEAKRAKDATEAVWAMVAHDLRTPLSVISLSSSELAQTERDDASRPLEAIQRSAERATDLLGDALLAMRLSGGALPITAGSCSVRELCATALDAVRPLARKRSIELVERIASGELVHADEHRIHQVLTNLLVNALKVSRDGDRVTLSATEVHDGGDLGDWIELAVEDEGPGIPTEQLTKIFSKFWAAGPNAGSGLGLWIARAIVEAHGSALDVTSEVGHGTRFSFQLPVVDRVDRMRSGGGSVQTPPHA